MKILLFLALFFLSFSLSTQEVYSQDNADELGSTNKKYPRLSIESHYVFNSDENVRGVLAEYPDLGLRIRAYKAGPVYFGAAVSFEYKSYTDTPSNVHRYDYRYFYLKPHFYIEFDIANRIRPWVSVGQRIVKVSPVDLNVPVQTGNVIISVRAPEVVRRNDLNITQGLAVDITNRLFVQLQMDVSFFEDNSYKVPMVMSDTEYKAGLGYRF